MDAYSISRPSHAERSSSRIYQDLRTLGLLKGVGLESEHLAESHVTMGDAEELRARDDVRKHHVGIVGAGLAGLRCADVLLRNGFAVTIIEGRNRVGGRMHQETLPNGHLIDLGPNWIHGTKDNPMLDIAKATNTVVGSWDEKSYIYSEDGVLLSSEDGERYSTIMWNIVQDAFQHSNKYSADISPAESLLDFFEKKVVELIPDSTAGFERDRRIVLQIAELWGAFVGSPIRRQSLKFFWLEECIEGENLFCAGTYQKVLEAIAKPAMERATIRFETTAARICCRTSQRPNPQVFTQLGEVLEFDDVVVTAPLGWLKKNTNVFEPPLPQRLTSAILSIGYGCLEKVYISFPEPFWLTSDADDRTVQGFCQWISPNYALELNPYRWTQEIVELASLDPSTSHPTLLFYIYGDMSKFLTDAVSKISTKKEKDEYLYKWFKPYYSRLPHYDEDSIDCRPAGCFATDWLHDDLAGNGSYSNFPVGLEQGDEDIRVMREGLPDCRLWLSGEHVAPYISLGTATGAYVSGEWTAQRIIEERKGNAARHLPATS